MSLISLKSLITRVIERLRRLLRMASPYNWLRKRVPADLTDRAAGLALRIPVGDKTTMVRVGRQERPRGNGGTLNVSSKEDVGLGTVYPFISCDLAFPPNMENQTAR